MTTRKDRNLEPSGNKVKDALENSVAELNREKGLDLSYPVDEDGHIKAYTGLEFIEALRGWQEAFDKGDLTFKNETKEEIDERKRKWKEDS